MPTDYAKVKRNIKRMVDAGAPEADIDAYLSGEGVTPEQLRSSGGQPEGGYLGRVGSAIGSAIADIPGNYAQRERTQQQANAEFRKRPLGEQVAGFIPRAVQDFTGGPVAGIAGDVLGGISNVTREIVRPVGDVYNAAGTGVSKAIFGNELGGAYDSKGNKLSDESARNQAADVMSQAVGLAVPEGRGLTGKLATKVRAPAPKVAVTEGTLKATPAQKALVKARKMVASDVARAQKNGVDLTTPSQLPQTAAERLGQAAKTRLKAATNVSPEGADILATNMSERVASTPGLAQQSYESAFGVNPTQARSGLQGAIEQAQAQATPLYENLRLNAPAQTHPKLDALVRRSKPLQSALKSAAEDVSAKGGSITTDNAPSFDLLDTAKRKLDIAESAELAAPAPDTSRLHAIDTSRRELVDIMDEINPGYAEARAVGGEAPKMESAFRAAKDWHFNQGRSLSEYTRHVENMTPAEARAALSRIADDFTSQVNGLTRGSQEGNINLNKYKTPLFQQKLAITAEKANPGMGAQQAQDFVNQIRALDESRASAMDLMPKSGSQTARLQEAARQLAGESGAVDTEALARFIKNPKQGVIDVAINKAAEGAGKLYNRVRLGAPSGDVLREYSRLLSQDIGLTMQEINAAPSEAQAAVRAVAEANSGSIPEAAKPIARGVLKGLMPVSALESFVNIGNLKLPSYARPAAAQDQPQQ